MDQSHFNTIEETRKSGRHLSLEERGMIQALHRKGYSLRSIAAEVNCAHTTVFYELRRDEDILNMADALNQRPRCILGYHTPMELFEAFLDEVYIIDNVY